MADEKVQTEARPQVAASPEAIRRRGNRLADARSLYLRQHGHNPVDWYPWGPEALRRARELDRPIFLSIGYSACHWCHVMEREVFEHDAVAAVLNAHFVPIKIDREERPDLDAAYMEAVLAMTGSGGWPMSVFATPAGKPFFGGTYYPKAQFLSLLERVQQAYRDERHRIEQVGDRLRAHIAGGIDPGPSGRLDPSWFERLIADAVKTADRQWGGVRGRMKFPMPVRWRFLLHLLRKTGDRELETLLATTLDQMASGGLQDHVGGGFHRYAVDPQWVVPHFEKMLYDNAQLAGLYLEAAAVFDEPRYGAVARGTLDFMLDEMRRPGGGFAASLDADSDGREGAFYVWTPEEIAAVVGSEDGPAMAAMLGVEPGGNFEQGRSVVTRRADTDALAARFGRDADALRGLFDRHREALVRARAERPRPGLDTKVVTAWNGLAIAALARGAQALGEPRYLEAADQAAAALLDVHRRADGGLYRVSNAGAAEHPAVLEDYALLAGGLLALVQAGGREALLDEAVALIDYARRHFADPRGAFAMTEAGSDNPLGRQIEIADGVMPSSNGAMLGAQLEAAALTGRDDLRRAVQDQLDSYAGLLAKAGLEMAAWSDAALLSAGPFYDVVVAGEPGAADTRALVEAFGALHPAHAVLMQVPAGGVAAETGERLPALAGKRAEAGRATAYVCRAGACRRPTGEPDELRRQVMEGWLR
jgi:hypothetical protein